MAASPSLFFFLSLILFSCISPSFQASFRPKALILPVSKDPKTLQYVTQIKQRTPLVPLKLTIDLGQEYLWVDCDKGYVSSSFKPVLCNSALCKISGSAACLTECYSPPRPGCYNNSCSLNPGNRFSRISTSGTLGLDVVSLQSTNGYNPGRVVSVSKFPFTCGSKPIMPGLAKGVTGVAGLGRSKISMPAQFASAFSFPRKFAICLASSFTSKGVVFFGESPYRFLLNVDASKSLIYTPLLLNPVSTAGSYFEGEPSADYFIGVKAININGKQVPLNSTLLSIDKEGNGGTKISTEIPYTRLQTSIYKSVLKAFLRATAKIPRVPAVAPFGACFNATSIGSTRVGPPVPQIDLVLQNKAVWRIFGANSMVTVKQDVLCLAFVDGGLEPRTSIVIGGHQIEDNLLQFDLARKRLGFSSSLLFRQTTCANFNFTSNA